MRVVTIDCAAVQTEAEFWAAYVQAAEPEGAGYFGRNLDAFWDAVHGGPGWPGDCELRFINTSTLRPFRDGAFLQALFRVASESTFVKISLDAPNVSSL